MVSRYIHFISCRWQFTAELHLDRHVTLVGITETVILSPISISNKTSYRKISWSPEVMKLVSLNYCITFKFDRHVGSTDAKVPVKFRRNRVILNSRVFEILRDLTIRRLIGNWNGAQVPQHVSPYEDWEPINFICGCAIFKYFGYMTWLPLRPRQNGRHIQTYFLQWKFKNFA